jgi:hypothetical protein
MQAFFGIMYTNLVLDRDIANFTHEESNHDNNNEMFFNTCPICNNGNIPCYKLLILLIT